MEARFEPTPRTRLRRLHQRGHYDRATVHAILDASPICHVGYLIDGQPFVTPTCHWRHGERLYWHGSAASRMLKQLGAGAPACLTVTLLDALVLARSAFHHSMNYRSVVVLASAREVADEAEKLRALDAIVEHIVPGRLAHVRAASPLELKATRVVAFPLDEASAKLRSGPPKDDEEDYALPAWAGELPLRLAPQPAVPDPRLAAAVAPPPHVTGWRRGGGPS